MKFKKDFFSMEVKDNTCNHRCSDCGGCCTVCLPVTKKEVKIIDVYVEENHIEPSFLSTQDGQKLYAICPFLDTENHKCKIYPVRPYVCRKFKCDKKQETLIKEREEYARRADYNGFFNGTPTASFQYLIYGDYMFDIMYRHLSFLSVLESDPILKNKVGELTVEKEMAFMPLLADREFIKKGGDK